MDYKALQKSLIKAYRRKIGNDPEIQRFDTLCKEGKVSFEDAYNFAKKAGFTMSDTIMKMFVERFDDGEVPGEAIDEVIPTLLKEQHATVFAGIKAVQEVMNRKAGIGMKSAVIPLDDKKVKEVTTHFKEAGFNVDTERVATDLARMLVDKTIAKNAEIQSGSGLKLTVTRIYDGIGIDHGKTSCEWCLSRCGEDVPYDKAKAMGMFQRHPGCGCIIETHLSKR